MMRMKCEGGKICEILVIIGGINWGLIGAFDFNLVNQLLGSWPMVERVVYILVGIAAIMCLFDLCWCQKCMTEKKK